MVQRRSLHFLVQLAHLDTILFAKACAKSPWSLHCEDGNFVSFRSASLYRLIILFPQALQGYEESDIIFVRENVSMHPRQQATERINGRFRLLKKDFSLFMVINACLFLLTSLKCNDLNQLLKKDFSLLFFGLWMQTWIPYTQRVNVGISTSNIFFAQY